MTAWPSRQPTAPWEPSDPEFDIPRSPWATEFYPLAFPYWSIWEDGKLHSALAPELPSLNVDDLPNVSAGSRAKLITQPDNAQLDRLFVSERQQVIASRGLRTWQIPALNTTPEPYYIRDHIPKSSADWGWEKYRDSRVIIREPQWLSFFSKQRWFDLRTNCLTHILDPFPDMGKHPNNWWTVDNPVIWDQLQLPIEIANRILLVLISEQDPW
jgi:hypothetical protein